MEIVVGDSRDGSSDSGADSLANISNEISGGEESLVLGVVSVVLFVVEVPLVRELDVDLGVVRSLYNDSVTHHCGSEHEGEGLDGVLSLGVEAGEAEEGEGLIRLKEDKGGSEGDLGLFGLVVEELDNSVGGDLVGDHSGLVSAVSADIRLLVDNVSVLDLGWDERNSEFLVGEKLLCLDVKLLLVEALVGLEQVG